MALGFNSDKVAQGEIDSGGLRFKRQDDRMGYR